MSSFSCQRPLNMTVLNVLKIMIKNQVNKIENEEQNKYEQIFGQFIAKNQRSGVFYSTT